MICIKQLFTILHVFNIINIIRYEIKSSYTYHISNENNNKYHNNTTKCNWSSEQNETYYDKDDWSFSTVMSFLLPPKRSLKFIGENYCFELSSPGLDKFLITTNIIRY